MENLTIPEELAKNFPDIEVRKKLMKEYGKSSSAYLGINEDGEDFELHIAEDNIILKTYQENGWLRVNYYDSDGYMEEEVFEEKWK